MAKKKFTDGLESLFLDAREDSLSKQSPLLLETGQGTEAQKRRVKSSSESIFPTSWKLFSAIPPGKPPKTGVCHFPARPVHEIRPPAPLFPAEGRPRRLIRRTIETSEIDLHYDETKKTGSLLPSTRINSKNSSKSPALKKPS
ncbi:MAG: hypothetical protein IPG32_04605 [Saprospirales bacterium]|nr:hypothetical protein [Saprospirales bacterium]